LQSIAVNRSPVPCDAAPRGLLPGNRMAELRRCDGSRSSLLWNDHLIGRSSQCALCLSGTYVSTQHALVRWDGWAWEILDRGSRNGTQLDGAALEPRRAYRLTKGCIITFGHADERWTLVDASPPQVMVVALKTGLPLVGGQGIIGVPSSQNPECTVYLDADGAWKLETAQGDIEPLVDGQLIESSGERFRFCCPSSNRSTEPLSTGPGVRAPTLHFVVSSDEAFVELSVIYPDRRVDLGSRSHNYLMLTLARAHLADLAGNVPPTSSGWMDKDEIADGLEMTPQQVDGEVFRIRKHFSEHGLAESASIIERRPRTKQIRLGLQRIRIERA